MGLFVLAPAVLWARVAAGHSIPVVPLLVALGSLASLYLIWRAPSQLRQALTAPWRRGELARVAMQVLAGGALLTAYVLLAHPERFLAFPIERTWTWLVFLGAYPLLSVLPQELLFRAFFFHRYSALLPGTTATILASAVAFGLAHLFYGNWLSVGLATLGGLCCAWTFARTGSLALVVLEHSLYGVLLFTLGLGRLFYLGSGI